MAYHPTPFNRASDALRYVTSLAVAASLIESGSSLPDDWETRNLVADLIGLAELVGKLGQEAMEEVEQQIERGQRAATAA
jgi:hypothetical protein